MWDHVGSCGCVPRVCKMHPFFPRHFGHTVWHTHVYRISLEPWISFHWWISGLVSNCSLRIPRMLPDAFLLRVLDVHCNHHPVDHHGIQRHEAQHILGQPMSTTFFRVSEWDPVGLKWFLRITLKHKIRWHTHEKKESEALHKRNMFGTNES